MSQEESPLRLELFGRTDVGQIREHNEDNFLVANLSSQLRGLKDEMRSVALGPSGFVVGVCDGMGGAAAGEVASQLAVDVIFEQLLHGGAAVARDDLARRLVSAIEYAGAQIFREAQADRSRRGMGTTATIAACLDRRVFIGQVGDSRAYLFRRGRLSLLTRDQSLVNQLIEAGQLTEEEAETFEHNNIILQALGTAETVQVDLTYHDLCLGDVLMLCSDGLSGMIRNEEIAEVLSEASSPFEACRELTERANAAGGHDNITVIVVSVVGGAPEPAPGELAFYQKYAIADSADEDAAAVDPARLFDTIKTHRGDLGMEGGQALKVSHTMLGVMSPVGLEVQATGKKDDPRAEPKAHPGRFARRHDMDDPVNLPTRALPPFVMGTILLSALVLAGLLGYLAIR